MKPLDPLIPDYRQYLDGKGAKQDSGRDFLLIKRLSKNF
jgi:hypothetical protein